MESTIGDRRIGLLLAAPALFGAAWLTGCKPKDATAAAAPAPVPVMVTNVEARDVVIYGDFAAQTFARNAVEVRGRVSGYIEKWLFKPGAEVRAGDVLYVLDLRPYEAAVEEARGNLRQSEADLQFANQQVSILQARANLASAEANHIKARQDYERLKPLVEADAASQQDLDAATAAMKATEANVTALKANLNQMQLSTQTQIDANRGKVEALRGSLRNAELNLQYGTIRAPVSGRIGDSLISVGGLVTPTSPQPLTTIVPLDPIFVRFQVTEGEYLSWGKQGRSKPDEALPVTLILADGTEYPWKGRIDNMLNQVESKTGTLEIQAEFPNPKHLLLPGQFGHVRLQMEQRKDAIAIPQKAIQQLQNIHLVYALDRDNTVVSRAVTPGPKVGDALVIEQGLKPGDRVIVEGLLKVRPGTKVQPKPYQPQAD